MGSFFSSDAYAAATPEEESSSAVLKFHSTARWQLHFNACKETSKLVTFRSLSSSTLQIWNFRFSDFCFIFFGWNRWAKLVIDFSAAWCGPCKMMEPVFNGMAAKFTDVDFVKIDVDELSVRHTSILSISWGFGFWFCFVLFFFYRSFRSIRNLSFWFFFFFFKGCFSRLRRSSYADLRAVEGRERSGQSGRSEEGRARQQGSKAPIGLKIWTLIYHLALSLSLCVLESDSLIRCALMASRVVGVVELKLPMSIWWLPWKLKTLLWLRIHRLWLNCQLRKLSL